MLEIGLFLVGFVLLVKGADWLVEGASSIAKRFDVSSLVIGLTIVAFGTSAPEFFVTLIAQLKGSSNIALGNVLGSNIANILLILGASAIVTPIRLQRSTVWKEIPFALLAACVLLVLLSRGTLDERTAEAIYRSDGLILLGFFLIFLSYSYEAARTSSAEAELPELPVLTAVLAIVGGIMGLALGGQWVVDGALFLARWLHIDQTFIGVTIIAVGTSLPELATSLAAAAKNRTNIAVGNVVGSNIFNVFYVLGITAIVRPYHITSAVAIDVWTGVIASLLLFFLLFLGPHHLLNRSKGIFFLLLYAAYLGTTYWLKQ